MNFNLLKNILAYANTALLGRENEAYSLKLVCVVGVPGFAGAVLALFALGAPACLPRDPSLRSGARAVRHSNPILYKTNGTEIKSNTGRGAGI